VSIALAVTGLVISGAAFGVAALSVSFSRRQLDLADRQRERDFEATVVAELVSFSRRPGTLDYELRVTNAGPAGARLKSGLITSTTTALGTCASRSSSKVI
jgi:hypothetical protein